MSWAEVAKMQEAQRDRAFNNSYVFDTSGTFTVPHNGYFKIIAIGSGGSSYYGTSGSNKYLGGGGGGGVCIKTKRCSKGDTIQFTITSNAVCDGMTASNGTNGTLRGGGDGGSATGGDYNYTGQSGGADGHGGSIGCIIPSLMTRDTVSNGTASSNTVYTTTALSGWGIYGHGGGSGVTAYGTASAATTAQSAAVIIIPLESL